MLLNEMEQELVDLAKAVNNGAWVNGLRQGVIKYVAKDEQWRDVDMAIDYVTDHEDYEPAKFYAENEELVDKAVEYLIETYGKNYAMGYYNIGMIIINARRNVAELYLQSVRDELEWQD